MDDQEESIPSTSKRKAEWFDIDDERNTYVYVTGLPTKFTEEEFIDLMKKYGVIARKAQKGNPYNIKMYKNEDGTFKGDGTCCFAKPESVDLAILHLDGYIFDETHTLKCEKAKFKLKGEYDPSKKPRTLDKKAKITQKKKLDKLLSWEATNAPQIDQKKVIIKNMFTPEEIVEDATLLLVLKEDVEEICEKIKCEPKRIDVYEKHPEGVIAVTFPDAIQAKMCLESIDGQYYACKVVKAELWDGKTKYKMKETDEELEKRTKKWHKDLEETDEKDLEDESK